MLGVLSILLTTSPPVRVEVNPDEVLNRFVPIESLGAGVDGREKGNAEQTFRPGNLQAMHSAGLRPLTYRLRTELGCEAWHWNPEGTWSDPDRARGYWTSSATPGKPIRVSWGYRLPRRGNTIDQANNDGYSRIDDGDPETYWKSNPYLDGDPTPQWIVIDLGRKSLVDAIRIRWGHPFATRFQIEYWDGVDAIMINENPPGRWRRFSADTSKPGVDGVNRLGPARSVRFVRILLTESSHTAESSPKPDPRDAKGYAIREVELGTMAGGRLKDLIRHRHDQHQTAIYTSSTDPWHRAQDLDPRVEQPGFDLVYKSGLTNGQPMLVPVPVLYDTPENAETEIRWLRGRGYPVKGIEMGEEPDGQYVSAEHYGALYARLAARLKAIDPSLMLGGPCFQTTVTDVAAWPDANGSRSWMRRFLDELARQGHAKDFQFFSFEWYPFDEPFRPTAPQLKEAPKLLEGVLRRLQHDGLSPKIPWMITEYGYSAFAGPAEVNVPAALLNLDIVAKFLELGGDAAYLYGYEPNELISEYPGYWGNLMQWLVDEKGNAKYRLPAYWASRLMMRDWATTDPRPHSSVKSRSSDDTLASYALKRPDGSLAVLLINKDPKHTRQVALSIGHRMIRKAKTVQWGPSQYAWHEAKDEGYPTKSLPPVEGRLTGEKLLVKPYTACVVIVPPK